MNAESETGYSVRFCLGSHWHVTHCGEDLALRGDIKNDQFTEARAREVAAALNNGADSEEFG